MELYHITNKKNIESITKNGLKPNIGSHSKKLETKPVLCLTEKEYIPYWKILLGLKSTAIFKIDFVSDDFAEINYCCYKEIRTKTSISPEHLTLVEIEPDQTKHQKAMRELCESRIYTFSWLCQSCARLYTDGIQKTMTHSEIDNFLNKEYAVLKNLDFSMLTSKEKQELLKDLGESGEFTFLDQYLNTEKKLYQLSMYDDPHTRKIRRKIEKLIAKAFDGCLDMCTGGWSDVT